MKESVLIGYPLDRFAQLKDIFRPLREYYQIVMNDYDRAWLERNIRNFEILIPNMKVRIDDRLLRRARRLKLIFSPTTGLDHIRISKGMSSAAVISLNDFKREIASISSTAELGLALILNLARKVSSAHEGVVKEGGWNRNNFVGIQLRDKTLGIIGLGRIGKKLARYGSALGMNITYWDKRRYKHRRWKKIRRLNDLLSSSDVIVIAIALSDETRYLINMDNINNVKREAVMVNISRGPCVEERSIIYALNNGVLSGFGTDVLEKELPDYRSSPLYRFAIRNPKASVIITPHIGGATIEAWRKVFSLAADYLLPRTQSAFGGRAGFRPTGGWPKRKAPRAYTRGAPRKRPA